MTNVDKRKHMLMWFMYCALDDFFIASNNKMRKNAIKKMREARDAFNEARRDAMKEFLDSMMKHLPPDVEN